MSCASCTAPAVKVAFRKVLVATDFSKASEKALRHAVSIARYYKAEFFLTHVVSSLGFTLAGGDAIALAETAALRDALGRERELVKSGDLGGVPHHLLVSHGDVWQELEAITKQKNIDLIVLGTHGRTGLRKIVLGSVAERIFRHASCPVLTVGPCAATHPPAGLRLRRVLYPTDLSAESGLGARYAASVAEEHKARLTLLHVVEPRKPKVPDRDRVYGELEESLRMRVPADLQLPHSPNFRVETGQVVETILDVADEEAADLIVMGLRTPHKFAEHLGWRHAYPVVCQACCPVLTVRSPREED